MKKKLRKTWMRTNRTWKNSLLGYDGICHSCINHQTDQHKYTHRLKIWDNTTQTLKVKVQKQKKYKALANELPFLHVVHFDCNLTVTAHCSSKMYQLLILIQSTTKKNQLPETRALQDYNSKICTVEENFLASPWT